LILLSAAAASFGGNSALAWIWTLLRNPQVSSGEMQMPEIERSWAWMVAAVILPVLFIAGLGPGVRIHSG